MALVTAIESADKERQTVHDETRCVATTFVDGKGKRYLQIDTYGSSDRKHPEKVSQSIQFNETGAAQLLQLIHTTFPQLASSGSDAGDE